MSNIDTTTEARDLLLDAQDHMQAAIDSLRSYVTLTGDRTAEAYILNKLRILTASGHGFLTNDINLDDVIIGLDNYEIEEAA